MNQSYEAPRVELSDRHQSPLTFYLRMLLFTLAAVLLRLLMLAPLAALFIFEKGSALRYLALLTPVLLLAVDVPLRMSFADALVQNRGERFFSFDKALSLRSYGEKLLDGMRHLLSVLKWALPLLVCCGALAILYVKVDVLTLMNGLTDIGKTASGIVCDVANFFGRLFGSETTMTVSAGMMEGMLAILAVLALCVVIFLYGALRNSAYRYIWVLSSREDRPAPVEARRRLRGRRFAQLLVGLINLMLWAPALYMLLATVKGVIGDASQLLMKLMAGQGMDKELLGGVVDTLVFTFFALYLPLLPIRRILTAAFATRNVQRSLPTQAIFATHEEQSPQELPQMQMQPEMDTAPTLPNE